MFKSIKPLNTIYSAELYVLILSANSVQSMQEISILFSNVVLV